MVDLWDANRYMPFDQLPKPAKAAVAAFADRVAGHPNQLGLGGKVDALKFFQKNSK